MTLAGVCIFTQYYGTVTFAKNARTTTPPNFLQPTKAYLSSRVNSNYHNLGIIITLKPIANMTKLSEFVLSSFIRSEEAKNFVNLAEYAQVTKN